VGLDGTPRTAEVTTAILVPPGRVGSRSSTSTYVMRFDMVKKRVSQGKAGAGNKNKVAAATQAKVSGAIPQGDVRLTANIRQDLHEKLKMRSTRSRDIDGRYVTVGELIEQLIEKEKW
jgi:hypothetical protein